jgi:hypothetical protein
MNFSYLKVLVQDCCVADQVLGVWLALVSIAGSTGGAIAVSLLSAGAPAGTVVSAGTVAVSALSIFSWFPSLQEATVTTRMTAVMIVKTCFFMSG